MPSTPRERSTWKVRKSAPLTGWFTKVRFKLEDLDPRGFLQTAPAALNLSPERRKALARVDAARPTGRCKSRSRIDPWGRRGHARCVGQLDQDHGPITQGVLKALHNGDRACYVVLDTPVGERALEGDLDLCDGGSRDVTPLIGRDIAYTTEPDRVQAMSCAGDPECTAYDEVDLVVTVQAAPPP